VTIKAGASPVQRNPEAAALYQKVIAERRGTPEEDERLRQLWIELSFDMMDIPDDELLDVKKVTAVIPSYAKMYGSAICSVCGESIMEPRARMKDRMPICLGCSTEEYYELNGNGMHILRRA
jgi:formylmethanofuran dehydrogenase subunit E